MPPENSWKKDLSLLDKREGDQYDLPFWKTSLNVEGIQQHISRKQADY